MARWRKGTHGGVCHGEGIQDHGAARDLKTGQLPPAEGHEGLLGDLCPWLRDDTRAGYLTETGVGDADDLHLVDRRMPQQKTFYFDGIDVFPAHLEEIF